MTAETISNPWQCTAAKDSLIDFLYCLRPEIAIPRTARDEKRAREMNVEWGNPQTPFSQFRVARSISSDDSRPTQSTGATAVGDASTRPADEATIQPRLIVDNLSVAFRIGKDREALAVEGASFTVAEGETLALVGESGSGKSVTCLALMRLLQTPPAKIVSGSVTLSGRELFSLPENAMRRVRGGEMAMIFQEPMTSFDPVYTMGDQLLEALFAHAGDIDDSEAATRVMASMASVGLPDPAGLMRRYPHELSGGMKQRCIIAMALLGNPKILLCDEPTTALDVTIQAQIMELLARIRDQRGMSMLFITHNLGLVAELAQRAAVMYAGRIVEISPVADLFHRPMHPYSEGLIAGIPRLDQKVKALPAIPGNVPGIASRPPGCKFAPRCRHAQSVCREIDPALETKADGRLAACHFPLG